MTSWFIIKVVAVSVALTLAAAPSPAWSEEEEVGEEGLVGETHTFYLDDLNPNELDVWLIKCTNATTKYLDVYLCDEGFADDTVFELTVFGKTPAALEGKGSFRRNGAGSCGGFVTLIRATPGPIHAYASVHQHNDPGFERYSLNVVCWNKNFVPLPQTVIRKQDQ